MLRKVITGAADALLCVLVLPLVPFVSAACGDSMTMDTPDAPQAPIDADTRDAESPADAATAPNDDPCRIVYYLPEQDEHTMANIPIRFGPGQGLEKRPDVRQLGLTELQNAHLDNEGVIEKRRGAAALADSRNLPPATDIPDADKRALWFREDELVLQTDSEIYSRKIAVPTSGWKRVSSWIQTRLRESFLSTEDADVINADYAIVEAGGITGHVTVFDRGSGAEALFSSDSEHVENRVVLDAVANRPRLTSEGDRVFITYLDGTGGGVARPLLFDTWVPGNATPTAFGPVGLTLAPGFHLWDTHATKLDTGKTMAAWIGSQTSATVDVVIIGTGLGVTYAVNYPGPVATISEVAVFVWPLEGGNAVRVVSVMTSFPTSPTTDNQLYVQLDDIDLSTAAVTNVFSDQQALPDPTLPVHSIAVSFEDASTPWVAVEQDNTVGERQVSYFRVPGTITLDHVHEYTSLVSTGAIVSGTPVSGANPDDPLNPGFVEQQLPYVPTASGDFTRRARRSGWLVYAPRTREYVSRAMFGLTGDRLTRQARPPKGSLIAQGDTITWGGPVTPQSDPLGTLTAIAGCKLDRAQRANTPAELDHVAVSPHGGYARLYDGEHVHEHSWHTLPEIESVTPQGAGTGSLPAGTYQVAATWEHEDRAGKLYRSAPAVVSDLTAAAADQFVAVARPLVQTERENVKLVYWITDTDGSILYRLTEVDAITGGTTITTPINTAAGPFITRNEQLDQIPGVLGVLPSFPDRTTDFVAYLGGRLWTRDPLRASLARFTIPRAEGFAPHWNPTLALEAPSGCPVTAVCELDGRTVLGTAYSLSYVTGDGPDATGADPFPLPSEIPLSIGVLDQTSIVRTPIGIAYGSSKGPRLLDRTLTVQDLGSPVSRQYEIDGGRVVGLIYNQDRDELVWLDDAVETLRWHVGTQRWASDSGRLGQDIAISRMRDVAFLLADGTVIFQDETFLEQGAAYATRIGTAWIREPTKDGVIQSGFRIGTIHVAGEYVGAHDLTIEVYGDFDESTPRHTYRASGVQLAANDAAGLPYIVVAHVGGLDIYSAAKIVVSDTGVGGTVIAEPSFRISGIDVAMQPDGSGAWIELGDEFHASEA